MRVAFFLDNRGIAGLGPLPDPRLGNPGIGGTEFAFLAVAALLQESAQPLLLLTRDQQVAGLRAVEVVDNLSQALQRAQLWGAAFLVFRPGVLAPGDWNALEHSLLPLVAWLHNLGCLDQARTEVLPALRAWVLVSGAQLDFFRHSRLSRQAVVIPNPVLVPAAGVRSRETALAARDLAYVGAITPFKAFDRLAAQWGVIARACPEVRLRVFGGADLYGQRTGQQLTPYELHCRRLLEASGAADRVLFAGSCGLERYGQLDSVAVGVVNPSGADETFCLSAAELSLCGIPVVSARRHALVQTVPHQVAGLLARNDRELAEQCIQLLGDPEQAWQLGSQGHAHAAQTFSAEALRAGWLALAETVQASAPLPRVPVSTPWQHEQRWLRQLWGALLGIPAWPSWPSCKAWLKGGQASIGPFAVGLLSTLVALLIWAAAVFGKYGGNPTGLARIGDQMALSPRLAGQELVVLRGKRGNDGQQFLALSLDPLQVDPGTAAAVDNPIYRGKRLLYPLLAWLLGLGRPGWIIWWLGLINVACIGVAAGLVARWAQLEQRSPQWGFAVLALPGYWITLSLGTADLLATTLMLAAALAWKQQRPWRGGTALAAALLSRETELLAWAATGLTALWEKRWHWLLPLALAPLPLLALMGSLRQRFSLVADGALASLHFTWPLGGIAAKVGQLLLGTAELPQLERVFDGLSLLLWLASLAVLLMAALGRWRVGRWLRWAAGLYLLPALCTSTQILARFPDYTRVWIDLAGLALLVLLSSRSRWIRPWLLLSAAVSAGYGVGYGLVAP
jgi:glycosyltransferase involved in cell wall biosynthesis